MSGSPLLMITPAREQQRHLQCAHPQLVFADIHEALYLLRQRRYRAVLIDLDGQKQAQDDALALILAAELMGDVAATPLLLACCEPQTQDENRLRLKGFDGLLPLTFTDQQIRAIPRRPEPDLHELYELAGHQQPVIDAMIPTLLRTLSDDLPELEKRLRDGSLAQVADLAHRIKSSFHLLGMRYARRRCIAMESAPALRQEQRISEAQAIKMRHCFGAAVRESYQFLQETLGVVSHE